MVDYVVDFTTMECASLADFNGCFEDAIRNAMKEYRSSKYRFDDSLVENEVRKEAGLQLKISMMGDQQNEMYEDDSVTMKNNKIGEGPWDNAAKRAGSHGGHTSDPTGKEEILKKLASRELSLAPMGGKGEEQRDIPMIRDPRTGQMIPDPFAGKARQLRTGGRFESVEKSNNLEEKKWIKTDPNKEGMFKGKSKADLESQKASLKKKNEKHEGEVPEKDKEKMAQLNFAIRAKSKGGLAESMDESLNLVKRLRYLLETEVSQAEVMMAAKGFAQELQEMVEKIGRLQNEDLPPVTDQMRETYGTESASAFQTQIYAALQGVMDALYTAKNQVDDAVDNMATTGQVGASVDMDVDMGGDGGMDDLGMGGDEGMGDEGLGLDDLGDELGGEEMGDEFGGAEEEEPLGRAQKESLELRRKVLEMRKLVIKARKLKESRK